MTINKITGFIYLMIVCRLLTIKDKPKLNTVWKKYQVLSRAASVFLQQLKIEIEE